MIDILSHFDPITLEEMSSVKLMNRTDTKFVTNLNKLHQLLEMAQADYFVQDIDGGRNLEYDTTYFDTTDFEMYCQHQCGHTNRQKIRFRTYCVSGLQFMEVKTKNNHGRTKKKRIEVGDMNLADEEKRQFLAKHLRYDVDTLVPALNNHFSRITLVNKAKTERLTIDSSLRFHNLQNDCERTRHGGSGDYRTETRRTGLLACSGNAPTAADSSPRLFKILYGLSIDLQRSAAREPLQTETY